MKKGIFIAAGVVLFFMISAAIVESISVLMNDLNAHAWQTLIGRWRSYDHAYYEIEFIYDGTFVEYSHGVSRSAGSFRVSDNRIELTYDAPFCPSGGKKSCKVDMEFEFFMDTLILTTRDGKSRYKRVKSPDDRLIGLAENPFAKWPDGPDRGGEDWSS